MRPNPFRCPACGLPANNVDGDPFAIDPERSLFAPNEISVFVACDNGHRWFEQATFSPPRIPADWREPIGAPEVISRETALSREVPAPPSRPKATPPAPEGK